MAHIHPVAIYYEDTDLSGAVYHANYLRYFEVARVEWLRARGVVYRDFEAQGLALPVIEANVRYRRSASYDDLLDVTCIPALMRAASSRFEYRIHRDQELIAEGWTSHACIDRSGRPVRYPESLRELLK